MNIESLRKFCLSLPGATEDVKWGNDLCFCIGGKMFCVTGLAGPFAVSLKVTDEEFEEYILLEGVVPAPYVARYKWIRVEKPSAFPARNWSKLIFQSYKLVREKLPQKTLNSLPTAN